MNKYSKLIGLNFVLLICTVVLFENIAHTINSEMIPFILVLLFGFLTLGSIVIRGGLWYKSDLAKRTIQELDKIEDPESVEKSENIEQ